MAKADKTKIKLEFYGWLKEPSVEMVFENKIKGVVELLYDPKEGIWSEPRWLENFVYQK